jgi:hypothetical protein
MTATVLPIDPVSRQLEQYSRGDQRALLHLLNQLRAGILAGGGGGTSIFYNVMDFGAVGDGVTDDTASFQAAHDAMTVLGGVVYAPAGTYAIAGTITFSKPMTFLGDGMGSTIIKATAGTGDIFLMTGARQRLTGFQIQAGVPQTADAYVHYSATASGQMIDHFYLDGWFRGILWEGIARLYADHGYLFNGVTATGNGITIQTGANNDIRLTYLSFDGPVAIGAQAAIGIFIVQGTNIIVQNCAILHHVNAIASTPGNGQAVTSLTISECICDGCGTRSIILRPIAASTGAISRVRIANCQLSNAPQHGILLDSRGGTINNVDIVNVQAFNNTLDGIQLLGFGTLKDVNILGGAFSNNRDGIRVGDGVTGVTDFAVHGIRATGNTGWGINVTLAACTNYRLLDNDDRGNTAGPIQDLGVVPKIVANNL